jgi:phage FluMu protein Com
MSVLGRGRKEASCYLKINNEKCKEITNTTYKSKEGTKILLASTLKQLL